MSGTTASDAPFDRHIALEGAVNFRDLGGYRVADGRTIRWRSLFRADDLSRLSRPDRAVVRTLGIATVIDLRSRAEVEHERFPVDEIPVGFHHLPLLADLPPFEEFRGGPEVFAGHYLDIARRSGDQVARALGIVSRPESHPVIVHCAAGKDRTGVLVAVLLALLGVDDETISEDYALSAKAMEGLLRNLLARVPDHEEEIRTVAATMFSATPANIRSLLDGLRDEFGSVEGYVGAHGTQPDVVAELRDWLLE
ncbi:MAG TPA: tyrosine-protein phosphatase [Acidimicrobiales bacterium]|nr:tyrosine-protein phosphatase [Acidimicrobiales bacterium]